MTFLAAGHATSAAGLSWALFALASSPKRQETLRQELKLIDDNGLLVISEKNAVSILSENHRWEELLRTLDENEVLDAYVREVLRLYPPITSVAREACVSHCIGEHRVAISKGTVVSVPILAIHRSEAHWGAHASEFLPERFFSTMVSPTSAPREAVSQSWIPFLHGPRSCIASRFAMLEIKAVLAVVVVQYSLTLAPGMEPSIKGSVATPVDLRLRFTPIPRAHFVT